MNNRRLFRSRPKLFVLLALPVVSAIAVSLAINDGITTRRRARKLRELAETTACPSCGKILGLDAITLATEERQRQVKKLMAEHPHIRFRLAPPPDLTCPACRAEFSWMRDGTLEPYPWGKGSSQHEA